METRQETIVWQSLQQGNPQALDYFYDTYVQALYNYGKKITDREDLIKDSIQDLFVDLWRNRASQSCPRSPKFYLLRSLRYKLLQQLKKEKRKLHIEGLSLETAPRQIPSPELSLITRQLSREKQQQLRKGLKKLSNRQREAVHLRFYEELSYEEIASVMSIHSQSVYNLIHESIGILKKSLMVEVTLLTVLQAVLPLF